MYLALWFQAHFCHGHLHGLFRLYDLKPVDATDGDNADREYSLKMITAFERGKQGGPVYFAYDNGLHILQYFEDKVRMYITSI